MQPVNKKRIRTAVLPVLVCAVAATLFSGCSTVDTTKNTIKTTILKVGKADAIVVDAGDETLVIDTGEEEDGVELLEYLAAENIKQIDTLIITHYDKDHVGGADTVIESIPVGRVIVPDYDNSLSEYQDFLVAMKEKGITAERINETLTFTLGDAEVIVEPPLSFEIPETQSEVKIEYDNNFSLVTTVIHGNNRLVFAADIEKQRIREWLENSAEALPCVFLKVPHHGVFNTELQNLFETLKPAYAAICDSNKNPASDDTVKLLKQIRTDVFQTRNGKIFVISDGSNVEVRQ